MILNFDAIIWISIIKPSLSPFKKNIILNFHSILSFTLTKTLSACIFRKITTGTINFFEIFSASIRCRKNETINGFCVKKRIEIIYCFSFKKIFNKISAGVQYINDIRIFIQRWVVSLNRSSQNTINSNISNWSLPTQGLANRLNRSPQMINNIARYTVTHAWKHPPG